MENTSNATDGGRQYFRDKKYSIHDKKLTEFSMPCGNNILLEDHVLKVEK